MCDCYKRIEHLEAELAALREIDLRMCESQMRLQEENTRLWHEVLKLRAGGATTKGIEIELAESVIHTFADPARHLAFVYRGALRGRKPESETICIQAFAEMLAMGLSEATIAAELKKRPPQRDRSEHLWQIKKRLGLGAGKSDHALMRGIAAFAGKENRNDRQT